jgi:hypothetical protein
MKLRGMRRVFIITCVLSAVAVLYFSCSESSVENKIDGTWRKVNVENVSSDIYQDWTLLDNYIYILQQTAGSATYDTINHGKYSIKIKRFSKYLELSESSVSTWDGEWHIDKLDSKYLVLERNDYGLEYYEFVKK